MNWFVYSKLLVDANDVVNEPCCKDAGEFLDFRYGEFRIEEPLRRGIYRRYEYAVKCFMRFMIYIVDRTLVFFLRGKVSRYVFLQEYDGVHAFLLPLSVQHLYRNFFS